MKTKVESPNAPEAPPFLSQAIVSDNLIFVSGQIHQAIDGTLMSGTVEEKLTQIMKNIESILKESGAELNNIVKATIYVTDMAQMPEVNRIYPTFFSDPFPAREAICVKELPLGATIEISVIATKH